MMRCSVLNAVAGRIAEFPFSLRFVASGHGSQKRVVGGQKSGHITWGYVARTG